jgi:hypothetical protein
MQSSYLKQVVDVAVEVEVAVVDVVVQVMLVLVLLVVVEPVERVVDEKVLVNVVVELSEPVVVMLVFVSVVLVFVVVADEAVVELVSVKVVQNPHVSSHLLANRPPQVGQNIVSQASLQLFSPWHVELQKSSSAMFIETQEVSDVAEVVLVIEVVVPVVTLVVVVVMLDLEVDDSVVVMVWEVVDVGEVVAVDVVLYAQKPHVLSHTWADTHVGHSRSAQSSIMLGQAGRQSS